MSAYLMSSNLPLVLHFTTVNTSELTGVVSKWMKDRKVMTIRTTDDQPATAVLMNFGLIDVLTITDVAPPADLPTISYDADPESLLGQLDD
jgi:hypothetical protein